MKTLMATLILLASTTLADAAVFRDDFNRGTTGNVGLGWMETGGIPNSEDVLIFRDRLMLQNTGAASIDNKYGRYPRRTTFAFDLDVVAGGVLSLLLSTDGTNFLPLMTYSADGHKAFKTIVPSDFSVRLAHVTGPAVFIDDFEIRSYGAPRGRGVPEPSTGALVGFALLGLWLAARRRGIRARV